MEPAQDEYRLEQSVAIHRVGVEVFLPFAAFRLWGPEPRYEALLTVRLRDIRRAGEEQRCLRLSWPPSCEFPRPPAVQETVITEWAALAVACAVLPLYTGLWIRSVATPGNSFDYWISDGRWQFGLEASGTMMEDLEARHREKVRQLRGNPYGVDGYVVTVDFPSRAVILSFNTYAETSP